jgi:hypothetical protein
MNRPVVSDERVARQGSCTKSPRSSVCASSAPTLFPQMEHLSSFGFTKETILPMICSRGMILNPPLSTLGECVRQVNRELRVFQAMIYTSHSNIAVAEVRELIGVICKNGPFKSMRHNHHKEKARSGQPQASTSGLANVHATRFRFHESRTSRPVEAINPKCSRVFPMQSRTQRAAQDRHRRPLRRHSCRS